MDDSLHHQPSPRESIPPISRPLHFYPFADGGVLFREGTRLIWALNSTSAYIWCLLESDPDIDRLSEEIASRFSIDIDTALRDVQNTIDRFEQEGLLGPETGRRVEPSEDDAWHITPSGSSLIGSRHWVAREFFETPNHIFEFCSTDFHLGEAFTKIMAHLALNRNAIADTRLAITASEGEPDSYDIYLDGNRYAEGCSGNEVLPCLATLVFVRACEALQEKLLFHASVLGKDGKTVLFPAEAGSGKSTLAAALAARGFLYYSDELAVLDVSTHRVSAFPLPMSIKPGSTEALEPHYPGLAERPIHHRSDDKLVRYLPPPALSLPVGSTRVSPIHALVFPRFQEGAEDLIAPLEKAAALSRLAQTGSSNREFTPKDVKAMIDVVENTPSFELVFGDLSKAVSLLEKEIFKPGSTDVPRPRKL